MTKLLAFYSLHTTLIFAVTELWFRPASWTSGDLPAVYRSFDSDRHIQLKNGAQIVVGKVSAGIFVLQAWKVT